MDSYGNSGFKGVSKHHYGISTLQSKNVRVEKLNVTGNSSLKTLDVTGNTNIDGGLTVLDGTVLSNGCDINGGFTVSNGIISLGNASSNIGFYGHSLVSKQAVIVDAIDNPTAIARLNELLAQLRNIGLVST